MVAFGEGKEFAEPDRAFGVRSRSRACSQQEKRARNPNCGLSEAFWNPLRTERFIWTTDGRPIVAGRVIDTAQAVVDPRDAAKSAGLRYVSDDRPGIRRKKAGSGFTYTAANGSRRTERDALKLIKVRCDFPAWTDVWICPFADGHIQATGRDAKGRKQYRYHARFREVRESTKYEHVVEFADELPSIREKVRNHMGLRGLPREKVLATVVHLLETTLIRVGNDDFAKQNNSYGLTTLKNRHVAVDGNEVRFRFTGKSGKQWSLCVRDRRVAKIIRACQDLPGQELLQYVDERGVCQDVTSTNVNDYLKEITGKDISAKDFRTWRERFWRRWRSPSLKASTAPRRRSATFAARSKKSPRVSVILRPFVASVTSIRRF